MDGEDRLATIEAKLDALLALAKQGPQKRPLEPNLKITEFAELIGKSRRSVLRDIKKGTIRRINGRIPRDQLSKYCS